MTATPSNEAWRQLRLRYELGAHTADTYHDAGFAVVLQDVVIGDVLTDYVAAIRSTPLVVVVLVPRPEVVASRELRRDKVAYREDFNTIVELDAGLREATPRIGLWLDTSDQSADETVDEIIERAMDDGVVAS